MTKPVADPTGWTTAVRRRRKGLLQRLVMGSASALVFSPLLGWGFSAGWLVAYFVIQFLEVLVFLPLTAGQRESLPRWRAVLGDGALMLNAAFFGSLSIMLWLVGGPMGGVCAAVYLSAGTVNSVILSTGSPRVMVLTVAPQLVYFGLTPWFMAQFGASSPFVTAAAIAVIVFAGFCLSTGQHLLRASRSELRARLEADRKREEAEAAMNGRAAFLAAVAHDLRTPISAIMTGADALAVDAPHASRRQHVALIADAGHMMKVLLDDLLDHARLDAGRMTVEASDFDLRAMLSQTARLWAGPARAKGLRLRLEGARSMPRHVQGDPMRLRQILNNLISNALKFTERGSVTLRLDAWLDEHGAHALVIEIADTGQGLAPDQLQRLFTPFDQTMDGVAARYGGSGLGLAISRDLIELMGGRLTVRSTLGEGAVFTIALTLPQSAEGAPVDDLPPPSARAPAPRVQAAPAAAPAAEAPRAEPAPMAEALAAEPAGGAAALRVLVVDDHDINRRAVQLILQTLECEITMAADGMAALSACEDATFDVIFMDVRMPELDGRETTRRIRAGAGPNAKTPVVAVTADTSPEDIAACTAAGMNYFVSKPLTPGALLGALARVLEEAEGASAAA